MAFSVVMPALEMAQETGKVVAWLKKEGEIIAKGQPLLEIETDKAVMEIEAPADGILAGVKASEGDVVPVGQTIAWIVAPGEAPPVEAAPAETGRRMSAVAASAASSAAAAASAAPAPAGAPRISPKARRLAKEQGVDITKLRGSGPGGEILASDVLAAAQAPAAPATSGAPAGEIEALGAVGRLMAERTVQSWTTVPHFFLARDVDAGALNQARERLGPEIERAQAVKLSHTDLLVALIARVLLKHPRVNASWEQKGIRLHREVNMGVAMAVDEGVVAAVIPNAHAAKLREIAVQRRDLAERARAGRLQPSDIVGATFTISNLGMYGVDAFNAIIVPPQAAILAVGRIADRVVPVEGRPAIRPMMTMTLSSDHRVIDGAKAAVFLNDVAEAIRQPQQWLE